LYVVVMVDPDRLGGDAGRIAREAVAPLNTYVDIETEVTIELRATKDDGLPDEIVQWSTRMRRPSLPHPSVREVLTPKQRAGRDRYVRHKKLQRHSSTPHDIS
jgi:hypothetical protein